MRLRCAYIWSQVFQVAPIDRARFRTNTNEHYERYGVWLGLAIRSPVKSLTSHPSEQYKVTYSETKSVWICTKSPTLDERYLHESVFLFRLAMDRLIASLARDLYSCAFNRLLVHATSLFINKCTGRKTNKQTVVWSIRLETSEAVSPINSFAVVCIRLV